MRQRLHRTESEEFLSAHRDRLVKRLARQTRDAHRAEDIAQEAILRAWETRQEEPEDDERWARRCARIARHILIDEWRRERMAKRRLSRLRGDVAEKERTQPMDADTMERDELAARARIAIEELPDTQRLVLELRIDGLTVPQIAGELNLPINTARTSLYRARIAVREMLKRKDY